MNARQLIEDEGSKDELFDLPDEYRVQIKEHLPNGEIAMAYLKVRPDGSFAWETEPRAGSLFYLDQAQLRAEQAYQWHGYKEASDDCSIHVVLAKSK